MSTVLIYCSEIKMGNELEKGIRKMNASIEFCQSIASVSERVIGNRHDILVLCLGQDEHCDNIDFASMRISSPYTKIIYASRNPGKDDVKCLEHGFFYYAGNAGSKEILKAIKAALTKNKTEGGTNK